MRSLLLFLLFLTFISCDNKENERILKKNEELENELNKTKNLLQEIKSNQEQSDEFDRKMECQRVLEKLKLKYNNVVGCYYSSVRNTCIVKYRVNGKIEEASFEDVIESKNNDYPQYNGY